jgi:hypothetical protein
MQALTSEGKTGDESANIRIATDGGILYIGIAAE